MPEEDTTITGITQELLQRYRNLLAEKERRQHQLAETNETND
jgi:hypothetical protein